MSLLQYGEGRDFKPDFLGGTSGNWFATARLAEHMGLDETVVVDATGKPEDDVHRFKFCVNEDEEVSLQAKEQRQEWCVKPEIYADPGSAGEATGRLLQSIGDRRRSKGNACAGATSSTSYAKGDGKEIAGGRDPTAGQASSIWHSRFQNSGMRRAKQPEHQA